MANPAKNALSAKIMAMREAVRQAEAVAAAQRSTRLPAQPQMPQAQRVGIGNRASAAVGPDAPAPRPAPVADRSRGVAVPQRMEATPEQIQALADKAVKYQQDVQAGLTGDQLDPLTVEEAYLLSEYGADPSQTLGRSLSSKEIAQTIKDLEEGRPVTPDQVLALRRSPADGQVPMPEGAQATPEQLDALDASDMTIATGGVQNLGRNRATPDAAADLAQMVTQYTTPTQLESMDVGAVRRLWKQISENYPAGSPEREALERAFTTWRPDPSFPDVPVPAYAARGMEDGRRRLAALEAMATDPAFTQANLASNRLMETAVERAASGRPPAPRQGVLPSEPGIAAAAEQFNALPAAVREDIMRSLANDDSPRAVNATALIELGPDGPSISPNALAALTRPRGAVGELLVELNRAMETGDDAAADAARQLIREADATERGAAISQYQMQLAVDNALRQAMLTVEPTPVVAASPGPAALRRPGAMTPEVKAVETPEGDIPGVFETGVAAAQESNDWNRTRPSEAYRVDNAARLAAIGASANDDLPAFFRGGKRLESRSEGSRLIDTEDLKVITANNALPAAREAVRLAQEAADKAKGVKALANAKKDLENAREQLAALQQVVDGAGNSDIRRRMKADGASDAARRADPDDKKSANATAARAQRDMIRSRWSDRRLNKAGPAETYADIVAAILGRRPRLGKLTRSSDAIRPGEMNDMLAEAADSFGPDDIEQVFLPGGAGQAIDDAEMAARGTTGRLGGTQQPSRRMGAMRAMFGQYNPLRLASDEGGSLLYASAEDLADDVLAQVPGYRRGTADYDLAREELARAFNSFYGDTADPKMVEAMKAADRAPDSLPAGDQRPGTTRDPARVPQQADAEWPSEYQRQIDPAGPLGYRPNTEGYEFRPAQGFGDWDGAADPIDTTGDVASLDRSLLDSPADDADGGANLAASGAIDMGGDLPNAGGSKPAAAGDASSGTLPAVGGGAGKPAASPKPQSKKAILADIKERSKVVYEETLQSEKDSGATAAAAKKAARKAQDDFIAAERASLEKGGESSAAGSGVTSPGQQPAVTAGTDSAAAPTGPAAANATVANPGHLPAAGAANAPAANAPAAPAAGGAAANTPVANPGQLPAAGAASPQQPNQWPNMQGGGKAAKKPKGKGAAATPAQPATPATPPPLPEPKSWIGRLLKYGLAGGVGIAGVSGGLNVSDTMSRSDSLDLTDAVGGDPGGGQGLPPGYVPGPATVPSSATEARLQAIIDRLESSRRGGATSEPTYGTYQNINFWR